MKNPYKGPVTQHQDYAITGKANEDGNFGVDLHNHKDNPHPDQAEMRRELSESQRAHPKPRGFHKEPNHGPTSSMAD